MSQIKLIPKEEVKKHNKKNSIWIIIHSAVYDVTQFLDEHPGGADSLMDYAGKDGTQGFEDVGHSDDARIMMEKYKIGILPPGETTSTNLECCPSSGLPSSPSKEKTWRTFDGTSDRQKSPKTVNKTPSTPRAERRVQSIVVPRERLISRRGRPCESPSNKLKWVLLALGAAIVIGVVLRKYTA